MIFPALGLVGRGRVSRHLAHWFALEGIPTRIWHRDCSESPATVFESCDTVLLAVSDDAIASVYREHGVLKTKHCYHLSGARVIPGVPGMHPLMTFGLDLYDLCLYRSIPFITETGNPPLAEVFPTLPNPSMALPPEKKPLYHALCVMSGNFTTGLWNRAFEGFEQELGLPAQMLFPYLRATMANLQANPKSAPTGPLTRGDRGTVAANLDALEGDPWRDLYRVFAGLFDPDIVKGAAG